jgi:hypothetical protein
MFPTPAKQNRQIAAAGVVFEPVHGANGQGPITGA